MIGGLVVASRPRTGVSSLVIYAAAFGVGLVGAASAPNLPIELASLAFAGAASVSFMSAGSATLQLTAEPEMRGRVMALWTAAFVGTTPIGGPIIGWVSELGTGRWGLAVGALACLAASALGVVTKRRYCSPAVLPGPTDLHGRRRMSDT